MKKKDVSPLGKKNAESKKRDTSEGSEYVDSGVRFTRKISKAKTKEDEGTKTLKYTGNRSDSRRSKSKS